MELLVAFGFPICSYRSGHVGQENISLNKLPGNFQQQQESTSK
jgi:hypothetical protein